MGCNEIGKVGVVAQRIGLIGVGKMGHGIGLNLLANGYSLTLAVNRSRTLAVQLLERGATEAANHQAVAEASDVLVLCVTGSPEVESVFFGETGVLAGAYAGQLVIDCSTGEPETVERVHAALQDKGIDFVDAPLARTPVEAMAGKLNTMVGGSQAAFDRAKPVLECFCENIFHMGEVGAGTRTKLINNLMTMGQAALIAEALIACKATGVDLQRFYEVISKGGGNSGIFQMIVPAILNDGSFEGMKFSLQNAAKDLGYFVRMSSSAQIEHRMGDVVHAALIEALNGADPEGLVGELVAATAKRNGLTIGKT